MEVHGETGQEDKDGAMHSQLEGLPFPTHLHSSPVHLLCSVRPGADAHCTLGRGVPDVCAHRTLFSERVRPGCTELPTEARGTSMGWPEAVAPSQPLVSGPPVTSHTLRGQNFQTPMGSVKVNRP